MYDNSQLQQYKNCPESYRLKYIEGLKKREEGVDEHDKNFGKAIHSGLERWYRGEGLESSVSSFKRDYPEQLAPEDLAKTQENGIKLIKAYINHYKEEDKRWNIKAVEVTDSFEIAPGISFLVKIDLIIEQQGCIYFVDHKTTGKALNWTYWGQFDPNSQVTAYTAYCHAKFGECSGGIINAIQLGYRQRAYKGEPAGFHYSFQRQLFNRDKEQVNAWREDTTKWIESVEDAKLPKVASLRSAPFSHVWSKNEGQCRFCSYKEICISCADEQIIEQLYEHVNPTEYLEGTPIDN